MGEMGLLKALISQDSFTYYQGIHLRIFRDHMRAFNVCFLSSNFECQTSLSHITALCEYEDIFENALHVDMGSFSYG